MDQSKWSNDIFKNLSYLKCIWNTSDKGEGEGGRDGVSCSSTWIIFVGIWMGDLESISFICNFGSNDAYWAIFSRL